MNDFDKKKAAYIAARKLVGDIDTERAALVAHTDKRYFAANEALYETEDAMGTWLAGDCEGCLTPIFESEPSYFDGEYYFCKKCAPIAGPTLDELLKEGDSAYEWFELGKDGYDKYVEYLKTLPRDQSLAS